MYKTYFVPDNTEKCGLYECPECGMRFLSVQTQEEMECPYCEKDFDAEIGPDEVMEEEFVNAKLIKVLEGAEEIEMYDRLLSLAITGGDDDDWL